MSKFLRRVLAAAAAGVMLTGCTMPGTEDQNDDNSMTDSYSYSPVDMEEETVSYSWIMQPSINVDNIIVFDGSLIDSDNEKNTAYKNYAVIYNNGKYGLIDYKGNIVVDPKYDDYYTCWCGEIVLFNVIDEKNEEYEYCTIDSSKQITDTISWHDDNSPRYYWDSENAKVYYKNRNEDHAYEYTGKKAVAVTEARVEYDDYGNLDIKVEDGALCGLAKKGELIVQPEYVDFYAPSYKGAGATCIAFKNSEGKWGYLDSDGQVIIDFKCDGDMSTYNGRMMDDETKSHPYLFNGDYVPVSVNGFWGYYDRDGQCIVNPGEFGQARPVHNGRAWVRQNDMWGIIQLGEIIEEEPKPLDDSSSKASSTTTSTTYEWTTTWETEESTEETSSEWTDTTAEWTDTTTEPVYTEPAETSDTLYTDPAVTDPIYTDISTDTEPVYTEAPPVDTEPVYTEPLETDYVEYPEEPAVEEALY